MLDERPPRPDRRVQVRRGRRPERVVRKRQRGAPDRSDDAPRLARGEAERRHAARRPELLEGRVRDGVEEYAQRAAAGRGAPDDGGEGGGVRRGCRIEEEQAELDRGEPVDHRVVDLSDHRRAPALDRRDHEQAPKRP